MPKARDPLCQWTLRVYEGPDDTLCNIVYPASAVSRSSASPKQRLSEALTLPDIT